MTRRTHAPTSLRPRALVVALLLSLSFQAAADDAPSADADHDKKKAADLSAVTVNARLSSERPQDIPFGLSVIDASAIENGRLPDVESVLRRTPGVDVNSYGGGNDANIRIRGVGSLNQVSMDDGSVALNMDGVAMSSRHASLATFDVDRVEVLKGPQGTLFGRNSEAGAINVTSRRPTWDTQGYLRAEVGQDGQQLAEGAIGGALSDQVAGRLALRYGSFDSWVKNTNDGQPMIEPKDLAIRGSVLWKAGDDTQVLMILEGQNTKHYAGMEVLRPFGHTARLDFTPGVFDDNHKRLRRNSIEVDHDLESSRITSITGYTEAAFRGTKGYDRTINGALYGYPSEYLVTDYSKEHVASQDLRWSSLPGADTFWVTGVNVSHSDRSFDSLYRSNGNYQQRDFKTDSYALYGETTIPLSDVWKVTGGLRYTHDHKDYDGNYTAAGLTVPDSRRIGENYLTGRVALSYELSPQTNLYVLTARGHKSRGFNDYSTQPVDSQPYRPARVDTHEVGIKYQSADRRLSLNGSVYLNEVKDDHLLGYDFNTMAVSTINANTRSKGVELEGAWQPLHGLRFDAGVSYIDAKVTSPAFGVSGGDVAAGNRIPDVPYWSGNLSVSYHHDIASFWRLPDPAFNVELNYRYVGARPADAQNHFDLRGYNKVDMRIGLQSGQSEFYVWVDNLTNAHYDLYGNYSTPTVTTGMPARGRTFGVGARWDF
ncbi:MAG: Pesticin receptor [Luteibacter sp.]|uniref:TonB-dependent receptor n=1 Tax=Luteibacter sp. TaxID=1886636 RepID=UPI0013857EDC|nr:TonB-dependent receptor [Luteibacter sp.]KAF1007464.1 MAG: Pesticin receptor [Luteibacter sp.]